MKEILKSAKSLSDIEVSQLIKALTSHLEKRKVKALKQAQQMEEQNRLLNEVKANVQAMMDKSGFTPEMLGFEPLVKPLPVQPKARKPRAQTVLQAEKQFFALNSAGKLELLFTRTLKEHKLNGTALSFSDLTSRQKTQAIVLVNQKNKAKTLNA